MIEILYNAMGIPETCFIGKRVFKRLFHENANLSAADKRIFQENIDNIAWQYVLKSSTIPIQTYEDDQREYLEIAFLQVDLKEQKHIDRIAEIMHRAIPYPLIIVLAFGTICALSLAHKRFSMAEKEAIVVEDFIFTDWIDLSNLSSAQQKFLNSLNVSALPHTHFFAFYSAIYERIIALNCSRLTGEYRIESIAEKREQRKQHLARCYELELQIAEYKSAIKKETQFNKQVDLNTQIKQLEQKLLRMKADL